MGVLDIVQKDFIAELKSGKTLAEVDDAIEYLVDEAGERLESAIENSSLTEDEASRGWLLRTESALMT